MELVTKLPPGMTLRHPAAWLSTWFGCGLMKFAPGTWGSAGAIPFGALIFWIGGAETLAIASLLCFAIGIWSSGTYAKAKGVSDPGQVVIDEVAGQWLTLCFVPLNLYWYVAAFFLFRAADIVKPFPANWCDRNLKGGLGIMLDDMVAGIYAGLALFIAHWLIGLV